MRWIERLVACLVVAAGYRGAKMITGASYRVKATPKAHEVYKGNPQTQVTRVAVLPIAKKKRKTRRKSTKKA